MCAVTEVTRCILLECQFTQIKGKQHFYIKIKYDCIMEGMEYLYALLCEFQATAPGLQGPSFFILPVEVLV